MTEQEIVEWMRAHPVDAVRLAIEAQVLNRMGMAMWCDKHGGHPVDADHLHEYGPETCHVRPLLWAAGFDADGFGIDWDYRDWVDPPGTPHVPPPPWVGL